MSGRSISALVVSVGLALTTAAPAAAEYIFATPTAKNQNRVYWLDRYTGPVGACQYSKAGGGPNGAMVCFPPDDGAKGLPNGDYDLLPSNWDVEWGMFRVNKSSGEVSLCLVVNEKVVCTPQSIARAPAGPATAP